MPRILGKKVDLREYRLEDLDAIREWVNDRETVRNLDDVFIYPHTLNMTEEYLNRILEDKLENERHFVIASHETDEYLGQVALMHVDWRSRIATLGIVIAQKENRDQGYGREAIELVLDFAFGQLNLHRVELCVREYNTRGCHLYLKCGFVEEGRKRKHYYIDGQYTDTILMGILKEEYMAR
ncbi:MAG: GNAT family N-acetyltransferase [Firmicutes bacterium]|nr:GNAT family N-acetyltransferase [Bacillota bacterium]